MTPPFFSSGITAFFYSRKLKITFFNFFYDTTFVCIRVWSKRLPCFEVNPSGFLDMGFFHLHYFILQHFNFEVFWSKATQFKKILNTWLNWNIPKYSKHILGNNLIVLGVNLIFFFSICELHLSDFRIS